jgi:hypothetical protein
MSDESMVEVDGETCIRIRKEIFGENYYITIGKKFVSFTVPRENDPNMSRERVILETISETINDVRGRLV